MPIDVPDIDPFGSTVDRKIKVWSTPRFLACVDLIAKIDLPLDAAWCLMTHDDNAKIFRAIKRTGQRKFRKNNLFEKEYDIDHVTGWSVLWFSGEFKTRLRITEHKRSGTVHFKLLSSDIMDDFDGVWTLKTCTQQALDKMYGKDTGFNPFGGLQSLFGGQKHEKACLIEFTQQVQPKSVPKPLRGLARRIAASSLKTSMEDIDIEARKIRAGKPTLPGFEQYADKPAASKKAVPAVASVTFCNASTGQAIAPVNSPSHAPRGNKQRKKQTAEDSDHHIQPMEKASPIGQPFGVWGLAAWKPWEQRTTSISV